MTLHPVVGDRPTVAAVITAYDRTDYVWQALLSVLYQTDRPDEIVVSVNFDYPPLEKLARENGVVVRHVASPCSLGHQRAEAIRATTSEVIALLDDDDLWARSKVAGVREHFRDLRLTLLRNQRVYFGGDEDMAALSPPLAQPGDRTFYALDPASVRFAPWLLRTGASANCSTLAFRRDAVESLLGRGGDQTEGLLDRVTGGDDTVFFLSALLCGGLVEFVKDPWTFYRVHRSASRVRSGPKFVDDLQDMREGLLGLYEMRRPVFEHAAEHLLPGVLLESYILYHRCLFARYAPRSMSDWKAGDVLRMFLSAAERRQPFLARMALEAMFGTGR